jgi:hypothetical protein
MAESGNQEGNSMWPSSELASRIYDFANAALIVSLVVGVVATVLIVWMGNKKETYLRRDLAGAYERASVADAKAAEANKAAEHERLARVQLEARIADRSLTRQQQHDLTLRLLGFAKQDATITASPSTPESEWFGRQLGAPLKDARWNVEILPGTATATVLVPKGVVVKYAYRAGDFSNEQLGIAQAAMALADELLRFGIDASAVPSPMSAPRTIEITISERQNLKPPAEP